MKLIYVEIFFVILSFSCVFVLTQYNSNEVQFNDEILELSFAKPWDYIKRFKYSVENINITTKDGYMLSVQRILGGKNGAKPKKAPVLFLTSFTADSVLWIYDKKNLAYKLVDMGHEIWLLNNRGSIYNKDHKYIEPNSKEYWNFSFHEMGVYDVPDTIDYILEKTKYKSLYTIGYSQGGTTMAIMLSQLPEYNKKVKLAIYLAPAIYLKNIFYFPRALSRSSFYKNMAEYAETHGFFSIFPPLGPLQPLVANHFCKKGTGAKLCAAFLMYLVGPNYSNVDWKNLPILISRYPSETAIKQVTHFGQFIRTGHFAEYANYEELVSPSYKPKLYNISEISAPAAVFHGKNDWLVSPQDATRFINQLPNLIMKHLVEDPYFNHLDFVMGSNKYEMIDKYIISLIEKFELY